MNGRHLAVFGDQGKLLMVDRYTGEVEGRACVSGVEWPYAVRGVGSGPAAFDECFADEWDELDPSDYGAVFGGGSDE